MPPFVAAVEGFAGAPFVVDGKPFLDMVENPSSMARHGLLPWGARVKLRRGKRYGVAPSSAMRSQLDRLGNAASPVTAMPDREPMR